MLISLQSVEYIVKQAVEFLKGIFSTFDDDEVCLSHYCFTSLLEWAVYFIDPYVSLYN